MWLLMPKDAQRVGADSGGVLTRGHLALAPAPTYVECLVADPDFCVE